jgi:hypothetical protein
MSNSGPVQCPLCHAQESELCCEDRQRKYFSCLICALIYVPEQYHLTPAEERLRYDSHQNSPTDPAYRKFLQRLLDPLLPRLKPGQQGLDFGCGPGPTLSLMLEEHGFSMDVYDPFYANDALLLERQYNFITCSEAIEHFSRPDTEWRRLLGLLQDGGVMGIMTQLYEPAIDFSGWYYKNDPTHIQFFSRTTFEWLAQRDNLDAQFYGGSVVILQKQDVGLRCKN